jgi:hypothetical protein
MIEWYGGTSSQQARLMLMWSYDNRGRGDGVVG